jgi:hypothetical protein
LNAAKAKPQKIRNLFGLLVKSLNFLQMNDDGTCSDFGCSSQTTEFMLLHDFKLGLRGKQNGTG